jgi:hypothetical protein
MSVKNLTQKITSDARIMKHAALYQLHVNNKLFYDRERLQRLLQSWHDAKVNSYLFTAFNGASVKDCFQLAEIKPIVEDLQKKLIPTEPNYAFVEENLKYFTDILNQGYEYLVLDGQHRMSSLKKLYIYNYDDYISDQKIRTDVYTVENTEEAREIYNIINSSKKVELYTGDIAPYIIPKILKYFIERFQKYCKPTNNPHCPNINLDQLSKRLQAYDVINRLKLSIENIDLFIQDIHKLNQFYADNSLEELCSYGHKEKIIREIRESKDDFYLGLYRKYEWIDRLLEYRENGKSFNEQNHSINDTKRKRIPISIRKKVWTKHFQLIKGECFCCQKELYMDDFECGHIIPVKDGGQNTIDNLEPVCRQCNQDMGTINLNVYKQLFF